MEKYDFKKIEEKWRGKWEKDKIYQPELASAKKPFYNLMMFPYPSAEGLHIGHLYTFSGIDTYGRLKRMQGYDVFEPIGLDAFGIHSENYALKTSTHPVPLSKRTEKNFYRQMSEMGNGFDWSKTVETNKPEYYKWTQWLFVQLFKKGLAIQKVANVNWCPSCLTVLSDEQVIQGKCERCQSDVIQKELKQWFFKITEYAERLLNNLPAMDWDESVKTMQANWIGKKVGAEIEFGIRNLESGIKVFTTRPDTLFGVTALILAPEHPLVKEITTNDQQEAVNAYVEVAVNKSEVDRMVDAKTKTGVNTGAFAINPINNEEVPIYIADYVLGGYGTGAIMLVPGHDQRDYDFAIAMGLKIIQVVQGKDDDISIAEEAITDYGILINSGEFDGLSSEDAKEKIIVYLDIKGKGSKKVTYHLRDWLISRQRYWGPPIPIIHCKKCGPQPVPEEQLPVMLPEIEDFRPTGTGKAPLASHPDFYKTICPNCGEPATRETDVSDTFLDSSWYFLRYPCAYDDNQLFDKEMIKKWLPVDMYIGGKEHTVLHLLYSRFITMVLKDLGHIDFEEPFARFRPNGLIIKDGFKMSKSRGNVINPDEYLASYGTDVMRAYMMFLGPFSDGGDFRDAGISGITRFINRVWALVKEAKITDGAPQPEEVYQRAYTIKKVAEDIENLHYNTAISTIMEYVNFLYKQSTISKPSVTALIQLLAPFAPFIAEELWEAIGQPYSVHTSAWPTYGDSDLSKDEVIIVVQVNGKTRGSLTIAKDSTESSIVVAVKADERLTNYLPGEPKKVIYIQNKLINFVLS